MKVTSCSFIVAISFTLLSLDLVAQTQPASATSVSSNRDLTGLLGEWYLYGDLNKVCYIATAGDTFFAINEINTGFRISMTANNILVFSANGNSFPVRLTSEYMLGYGWWWSRNPINLKN